MALTEASKTNKQTPPCPWGNVTNSAPAPCSFSTLMDEEYAKQIEEEDVEIKNERQETVDSVALLNCGMKMKYYRCIIFECDHKFCRFYMIFTFIQI